ncbi:MAG TPA: hypothetical protein VFA18_19865, partial [Gemmataceae bacterium]|nr:hypothetical protein [Gemmataceae bacterium]
ALATPSDPARVSSLVTNREQFGTARQTPSRGPEEPATGLSILRVSRVAPPATDLLDGWAHDDGDSGAAALMDAFGNESSPA